jgi:hypothetical protein
MLPYPTFNASGDTSPCLLSSSGVVLNEHSWQIATSVSPLHFEGLE